MTGIDLDTLDVNDCLANPFFQKIDPKEPFVWEPSLEPSK
jgi:hypothetical protein